MEVARLQNVANQGKRVQELVGELVESLGRGNVESFLARVQTLCSNSHVRAKDRNRSNASTIDLTGSGWEAKKRPGSDRS